MKMINPDNLPQNEGANLEYKQNGIKLSVDMWKSFSAFANTSGGLIVLGVRENKKPGQRRFVASGVTEVNPILEQFWNQVRDKKIISYNPVSNEDVKVMPTVDGKSLIAIQVNAAPEGKKPVYLHGDLM